MYWLVNKSNYKYSTRCLTHSSNSKKFNKMKKLTIILSVFLFAIFANELSAQLQDFEKIKLHFLKKNKVSPEIFSKLKALFEDYGRPMQRDSLFWDGVWVGIPILPQSFALKDTGKISSTSPLTTNGFREVTIFLLNKTRRDTLTVTPPYIIVAMYNSMKNNFNCSDNIILPNCCNMNACKMNFKVVSLKWLVSSHLIHLPSMGQVLLKNPPTKKVCRSLSKREKKLLFPR